MNHETEPVVQDDDSDNSDNEEDHFGSGYVLALA